MLSDVSGRQQPAFLERWLEMQTTASGCRPDRISPNELRQEARDFLTALDRAAQSGTTDVQSPAWADVRHVLDALSSSRAERGFSPSETAMFVLSLKEAVFEQLRGAHANDPGTVAELTWESTMVRAALARLGRTVQDARPRSEA